MDAVSNVVFAMKQSGVKGKKKELKKRALYYLEKVGLADAAEKYPSQLSGGMQQGVAIARVMAGNADLFLMDEPFGAIDPANRRELQQLIVKLAKEEHKTVLFVTHDIEEAIILADRIVFMADKDIQSDIAVDIARPRTRENLIGNKDYLKINQSVMNLFYKNIAGKIGKEEVVI